MSTFLQETNKYAYQYCESIQDKLHQICEPLSKLGITYFGHTKIFNDGSFFRITNTIYFQRDYFFKEGGFGNIFVDVYSTIKNKEYFLTPYDKISVQKDRAIQLAVHHNILSAFHIYTRSDEYLSGYLFGVQSQDIINPSIYINNIPLLEHFIHYFNEKAVDLIDVTDKSKLAHFDQQFNFYTSAEEDLEFQKIREFLQETQIKKRDLHMGEESLFVSREEVEGLRYLTLGATIQAIAKDLEVSPILIETSLQNLRGLNKNENNRALSSLQASLSPRQKECLFLLTRAKTAKQIARILGIKHRTAETHIDLLKNKLNCKTKEQLIEKAFESGFAYLAASSLMEK